MPKVKFRLGTENHVQISLPSKMYGNGDVFIGRAKVRVSSLTCSQAIKIHKDKLSLFFADVTKAYETLKGEFSLESEYNTFSLHGEITSKGQIRILVKVGYQVRNHPDYTEWFAEAAFNNAPYILEKVIENQI